MEEGDVNNGGDEAGKTECISHGENSAEIQMAFLLICLHYMTGVTTYRIRTYPIATLTVANQGLTRGLPITCSFTLNGPGLSVNSHFRPLKNTRRVTTFAIKCPSGTTAIWAEIELMVNGSRRYQKNWLRKERRKQASAPRSHVRNVTAGKVGSSVTGTVRATCSTGEFSPSAGELDGDSSLL
nr:hypothetical protein TorRG33x02_114240 [Ipomoea trifida]